MELMSPDYTKTVSGNGISWKSGLLGMDRNTLP